MNSILAIQSLETKDYFYKAKNIEMLRKIVYENRDTTIKVGIIRKKITKLCKFVLKCSKLQK